MAEVTGGRFNFTPEQELILMAVRTGSDHDRRILKLLQAGIDWRLVQRIASGQGVLPLVYDSLTRIGRDLVPHTEMAGLREAYRANALRNISLATELLKVLKLLASRDIAAIPFKGPVLAAQVYGDLSLRQFVDLDILVRREDVRKTEELLVAHGYRQRYELTPAQVRAHVKRTCEYTFFDRTEFIHLDVHWRFAADYFTARLDPADAFARRQPFNFQGNSVPTLAAEDMLLYLCLHGTFHLWAKLNAVCDVARLIEVSQELDWWDLLQKAEAAGLRRTLLLGVTLARDFMATEVPMEIAEAADSDQVVAALRADIERKLFTRGNDEPGFVETARLQLLAKDRFPDRIRYCFIRALFPTVEDWQRVSLPDCLYFLYFLLRPLRLAGILPLRRLPPH